MNNTPCKLSAAEMSKGLRHWSRLEHVAESGPGTEEHQHVQLARQHRDSLNDVYWELQTERSQKICEAPLAKRFWQALVGTPAPNLMNIAMATIGLRYKHAIDDIKMTPESPATDIDVGLTQKITVRKPLKLGKS